MAVVDCLVEWNEAGSLHQSRFTTRIAMISVGALRKSTQ